MKITNDCLKQCITLDKLSVQLIPANGKQSDNKGQTSSATVMSRQGKLSEHLLAYTKPREMDTNEKLTNDTCHCRLCQIHSQISIAQYHLRPHLGKLFLGLKNTIKTCTKCAHLRQIRWTRISITCQLEAQNSTVLTPHKNSHNVLHLIFLIHDSLMGKRTRWLIVCDVIANSNNLGGEIGVGE